MYSFNLNCVMFISKAIKYKIEYYALQGLKISGHDSITENICIYLNSTHIFCDCILIAKPYTLKCMFSCKGHACSITVVL